MNIPYQSAHGRKQRDQPPAWGHPRRRCGPCLKLGTGPHEFVFTLYALKGAAEIEAGASPGMILADVMRESLGTAAVTYRYGE